MACWTAMINKSLTMKLYLFAVLPFASQADYWSESTLRCYTGSIKIGANQFTEGAIMAELEPQVRASVMTIANADPSLAEFLKTRGTCQADCLGIVMKPTLSTLYGKLGEDFASRHKRHIHDLWVEALFGAFRACYPHPPRGDVRKVAEAVMAGIGSYPDNPYVQFPAGVNCTNQGHESDFDLEGFLKAFLTTLVRVVRDKPEMQKYFDTQAKDCQKTCLERTVPASVMTLFLTANADEDAGIDALTGAIHACFPGVPHEDINALVSETRDLMDSSREAAEDRLSHELQSQGFLESMSFEMLCAFFSVMGCLAAVVVYGLGVVGHRAKQAMVRPDESYRMETYQLLPPERLG